MIISNPVLVQVYLDSSQKDAFQDWCKQNDITMSQQLRRLVKAHLKEEGISPPYQLKSKPPNE